MLNATAIYAETPNPHAVSAPNFRPTAADEVRRMADLIIGRQKDGQATHYAHLSAAGFSPSQIGALFPEAAEIANRSTFRCDDFIPDEVVDPYLERPLAERMADTIIKGMKDARSPIAALQRAGFTGVEIALCLDEASRIVDLRLRRVAPPNRSLVSLTFALSGMVKALQNEVA